MCVIIIIDGDNTLWDTNSVFTNAQIAILEKFKEYGLDINPIEEFKTLRKFDDMLIKKYNKYEYDFRALPYSLYIYYKKQINEINAIDMAYDVFENQLIVDDKDVADDCYEVFKKEMLKIPHLFSNVTETLMKLKKKGYIIILSSEGKTERIYKILRKYNLNKIFDIISTGKKSIDLFRELINDGKKLLLSKDNEHVIVIGDMLKREIFMGNSVGAITVYKPGGYKPNQKPTNPMETPDYEIKKIAELINVIC